MRDNSSLNHYSCEFSLNQTMNSKKNPTFESQIEALEKIVNQLEVGDLPLNDSLSHFEKGIKLTKDCQDMLNQAEQKVQLLSEQTDQLEDFE